MMVLVRTNSSYLSGKQQQFSPGRPGFKPWVCCPFLHVQVWALSWVRAPLAGVLKNDGFVLEHSTKSLCNDQYN